MATAGLEEVAVNGPEDEGWLVRLMEIKLQSRILNGGIESRIYGCGEWRGQSSTDSDFHSGRGEEDAGESGVCKPVSPEWGDIKRVDRVMGEDGGL